ncbi:DUF1203 domain-containing protein, partial [Streptomyces sp. MBT57]|nr:DUF1203 domain-containing protein [Streptomyces sp. MBT57]
MTGYEPRPVARYEPCPITPAVLAELRATDDAGRPCAPYTETGA